MGEVVLSAEYRVKTKRQFILVSQGLILGECGLPYCHFPPSVHVLQYSRDEPQAVEKAKSTDTDKVIAAMAGQTFKAPGGFISTMDPKNHHLHKPVFIGEIKADGQFKTVWKTPGPIKAQPWSPYIEGNDKKPGEPVM